MKEWLAVLLACVLVVATGVLGQILPDHSRPALGSFESSSDWLDERLPRDIAGWTVKTLDTERDIFGAAGATHYLTRGYTEQTTGETVEMVLLYGDPIQIHEHTPEVCYPASGFQRTGVVQTGWIEAGPAPAAFAVIDFIRRDSAPPAGVSVWYAWRGQFGPWRPHVKRSQLAHTRNVWRLTVSCPSAGAAAHESSPSRHFLQAALPQLEKFVTELPPGAGESATSAGR